MRAQAHTLEGIAAALLVVAGVSFALQATAVTPLSASTSNQHVENQLRASASSLLDTADESGSLVETITYWNNTTHSFHGAADSGYYVEHGPPTAFGEGLNETFIDRRVAVNVEIAYLTETGAIRKQRLLYMGEASDNAVSTSKTVVLHNSTSIRGGYENVSAARANGDFYIPDAEPGSELYNVVDVEVTVWRI